MIKKILITGGAGYVGSALADELVKNDYDVTVLDLCIYGKDVFKNSNKINLVVGDIRDITLLKKIIPGHDAVIHLACISNDPSFELNPELGKSINLDAFEPIVKISKDNGIKRFIYASSSSVYGIKEEKNVHEEMELKPLTDYSKFKVNCEEICLKYNAKDFDVLVIRPATVCGYSIRQRFDLVVNILTNLALNNKPITVYGGEQLRPNVHINDMVDSYIAVINADHKNVNGQIFNVGFKNQSVNELANDVKEVIGSDVKIIYTKSDDNRSYHVSSEKIRNVLNFNTKYTVKDAVSDLKNAFEKKDLLNTFNDEFFFNIKRMQSINLK